MNTEFEPLFKLSRAERIQLVEDLWDSIVEEEAELSVSSDYFTVEIKFEDKTSLVFDLEPCVRVLSEVINWKTGNYKLLRRWRPVHSESSRV